MNEINWTNSFSNCSNNTSLLKQNPSFFSADSRHEIPVDRNLLVSGDWYSDAVGQKLDVFVVATVQLLPVQPGKHSTAPVA